MLRTLHRCPVHEVPYIWSPQFLDHRVQDWSNLGFRFGYQPGSRPWRLAIFEPNISLVKNCLVPMLVCDEAYRAQPLRIASMQVLNTLHMKDHPTMLYLANSLDLVQHHKATFHGRHDFAGFMVQHANAVVAHQFRTTRTTATSMRSTEITRLVHNSPWLRDAGYYYPAVRHRCRGRATAARVA